MSEIECRQERCHKSICGSWADCKERITHEWVIEHRARVREGQPIVVDIPVLRKLEEIPRFQPEVKAEGTFLDDRNGTDEETVTRWVNSKVPDPLSDEGRPDTVVAKPTIKRKTRARRKKK